MIHPELLVRLCHARDLLRDWEDEPLPVSAVARASGLTRFHFIRLFKAIFGETPHQYRSRAQIEKARHLLILTNLSITEICMAVGFSSLGSFSALFSRRVGNVAVGISATVPACIGAGTPASCQLDPRLPFTHGRNFREIAIFEKTARGRG